MYTRKHSSRWIESGQSKFEDFISWTGIAKHPDTFSLQVAEHKCETVGLSEVQAPAGVYVQ